jgi:hypothetical protein
MRLCPAAQIVVRKLLAPMELGGYTIPQRQPWRHASTWCIAVPASIPNHCALALEVPRTARGHLHLDPVRRRGEARLAASHAQLLMKQVIVTTLSKIDRDESQLAGNSDVR